MIDNNTDDSQSVIQPILDQLAFPFPVTLRSYKHLDAARTHSWSTNIAVGEAQTPWVFFTRADYLLATDALQKLVAIVNAHEPEWDGFVTARGCHLDCGLEAYELTRWRELGAQRLEHLGTTYDYTPIDAGVWLGRKDSFDRVGGLNEGLTAWGHAQTHFQWKLYQSGVEFVCHPDVLFFHPQHGGDKDIDLAHRQLADQGLDLRQMWARYVGPRVY